MPFLPIAIVGQGCVFPGALSPEAMWDAVGNGRDLTTTLPADAWPIDPSEVRGADAAAISKRADVPFRGGFVTGFEQMFDPSGLHLPTDEVMSLDRSTQWLLEAARQAMVDAGRSNLADSKAAVILGNHSYPTSSLVEMANRVLVEEPLGAAELPASDTEAGRQYWANRFSSGRPAHLVAHAFAANGPAFCLDAACATSIYAIKLACDYLQDGTADIALSGAVCGTDNVFLHLGFSEITALSPTGMSRPFSRLADGLLPAEGAGVLVLKRLNDAVYDGDRIHGVIRGIGLSNDGRRGGQLAPDKDGQIEALERAYRSGGVDPSTVSLLECHATGTPTGDRVEINSAKSFFGDQKDLPVGSLKSNLGHLLTAAGVGAIIKVTGAMAHEVRPPTINAERPLDEFEDGVLRPLQTPEPWDSPIRRAGINGFGFGGNNAHLILDAPTPDATAHFVQAPQSPPVDADDIVICGAGLIAGDEVGLDAFTRRLFTSEIEETADRTSDVNMPLRGLKFPPVDLQQSLAQQTAVLEVCRQAIEDVAGVEPEKAGVVIGMGCDADAARPGLRVRLDRSLKRAGTSAEGPLRESLSSAIGGLEGTGYVIGAMPNLPANRVNFHHDWRGFGYTVANEELSGITALEIAARALRAGELDLAVAGAVDFSDEPVHKLAAAAVLPDDLQRPADAAIVFALKRRSDAVAAGDPILGAIEIEPARSTDPNLQERPTELPFGHAHAADGMVRAAATLASASAGIDAGVPLKPDFVPMSPRPATLWTFTGLTQTIRLSNPRLGVGFGVRPDAPHLFFARAQNLLALREALATRNQGGEGHVSIAIVARSYGDLTAKIDAALRQIDQGQPISVPGVRFGERALNGGVAFVYTGSAAVYPGMGLDLAIAFPEIAAETISRPGAERARAYFSGQSGSKDYAAEAAAMTVVAILGTKILRDELGITPQAALGMSLGEAMMLVANDVWPEPASVLNGLVDQGIYEKLSGNQPVVARYLGLAANCAVDWRNYEVMAPVDEVKAATEDAEQVWVSIVSSPSHCLISGSAQGCAKVIERLGPDVAFESDNRLAFHGPFAGEIGEPYRRLHTQPVTPATGMRFYGNALHDQIAQESDALADALTHQVVNQVDFRPTVEKAWEDGIRIFVDIGPRCALANAVTATLGDRPHLAVGLDRHRRDGLMQVAETAAALYAAGQNIELTNLSDRFRRLRGEVDSTAKSPDKQLTLQAHLPRVSNNPFERLKKKRAAMTIPPSGFSDAVSIIPEAPALPAPTHQCASDLAPSDLAECTVLTPPPEISGFKPAPISDAATGGATRPAGPNPDAVRETQTDEDDATTLPRPSLSGFVASPEPVQPLEILKPEGPAFDRAELEVLAGGKISEIFGPLFEQQDNFARQCRMPIGSMLLADRVLGISGEAGELGKGVVWTETDITPDSWYLHQGTMPTGLLIEAGQADLLLASWMGVDFINRDKRVYRLLGCEITFHDGPPPRVGDTIRYQIHIDGHAKLGDTRMFFFRYDAYIGDRLVSSVRHGQAGFFSDVELAHSRGVLWSPEFDAAKDDAMFDPAPCITSKREFTSQDVRAWADGDAHVCFGAGFEPAACHERTPTIPGGRLQLIDRVTEFDPTGGHWGRGYLKAEIDVPVDAWFYDGHFKNDPCMPGTLMAEAATQALAFHMAGLGFTIDRDGWLFQPVARAASKFVCRGQVVPDKPHHLTYEVFVEEIVDGDEPMVFAALLASCDGRKVFLCRRFGLKLTRDWPLYAKAEYWAEKQEARIVSPTGDVPGDYNALLACAWGKPSDAFGWMYERFDSESSVPRLPGPPYHCISRVVSVDCPPGEATTGGKVVTEFDVDPSAWYFDDGGNEAMPFSILSEVALQPCGWLASYMGFALQGGLKFRNLDGSDVHVEGEVTRTSGPITVEATFTGNAGSGDMTIVFYDVTCRTKDGVVFRLKTDFGFFPADALAEQKGLAISEEQVAALEAPTSMDPLSLVVEPVANDIGAGMPANRLAVVDQVDGFWPTGGRAGLGRAMGKQKIDPAAWYFRAHFFEDPVQPGSLGLEALFTLFKAAVKLKGLHKGFEKPRFEAPASGTVLGWKYRGQVVPTNKEVTTEIDILDVKDEGGSLLVTAEGSLWVDGRRIYEVFGYAIRIRESGTSGRRQDQAVEPDSTKNTRAPADLDGWAVDADADVWLKDHCPTYCLPVYPMMAVVGDLLCADDRDRVVALANVEIGDWIRLDQGPANLFTKVFPSADGRINRQLFRRTDDGQKRIGRATEIEGETFPKPPAVWAGLDLGDLPYDPYGSGELFHYEAFQLAQGMTRSPSASRFFVDVAEAWERANGHAGILLDSLLHGIPHGAPHYWFGKGAEGMTAFPYRLEALNLYAPLPRTGTIEVVSRASGMPTPRTIRSEIQVLHGSTVVLEIALVEALVPLGRFDRLHPSDRKAFAREFNFVPGWSLAEVDLNGTTFTIPDLQAINWLPGTVETLYGLPADGSVDERMLTAMVAMKDHFAVRRRLHPAKVIIEDDQIVIDDGAARPLSELEAGWIDDETFRVLSK